MCAAVRDPSPWRDHNAHRARADLEDALAAYASTQTAVLCQSGWEANIGLLQSIADRETPVYIDARSHMSLYYGARAAGAPVYSFRRNSLDDLRALISSYGPGIIAVDAIDSTGGSRAALASLCTVAEESGGLLVVDESHALGVIGPEGAGMVVALGLTDRVAYRTASLAKAFTGRAGLVLTDDPHFADYFRMRAAPAVFSSAVRDPDIAALTATLAVITDAASRRARLEVVGVRIRRALGAMGFELVGVAGHLVSLPTGSVLHAIAVRDRLEAGGVFGSLFWPPATPDEDTLIRFSLHAALTDTQVGQVIDACRDVADTFGPIPPAPDSPRLVRSEPGVNHVRV
ncbi:hypothetical protein BOX37_13680 [Nocardia mangyaensis]|uniref:8-amino-7-oxononanoate synthase n=1 Tax=Nocardia mangyaensis TaxID=2213200 RepID=A0A1J0VS30_9NOCA|nr:hypothetical protein BOX37_13680 [Nocardia mangyaensis]